MIIGIDSPIEIGKIRHGIADLNGKVVNQPYLVIGESTFEEWYKQYLGIGGDPTKIENIRYQYYYKIQTD